MLKKLVVITLVIAIAAAIAACGGGSSEKVDVTINLKAENNRFVPDRIEVPAGKTVKITLQNLDAADHDLEVMGLNPKVMSGGGHGDMDMGNKTSMDALTVHSQGKKSASVTFVAERAGTYDFICTQQGHKEVGMVGKMVVTSDKPTASEAPRTSTTPAAQPSSPTVTASGSLPQMPQMQPPSEGGHEGH